MTIENRITELTNSMVDDLVVGPCTQVEFVDEILPRGMTYDEVKVLDLHLRYRSDRYSAILKLSEIAISRAEIDDMVTAGSVVRLFQDKISLRAQVESYKIRRKIKAAVRQFNH